MSEDVKGITVAVRVRPLNEQELTAGNRVCVHFDEETGQVALTAVDKGTLLQLKGQAARGYAFDRRYGMDDTSDKIFKDCVEQLVNNVFKGYNGTVLAYGQTGSGKTHTMSGGIGHYGVKEQGITPRVISHVFNKVENIKHRLKPGESIQIAATAVEIYNDEFRDLSRVGTNTRGSFHPDKTSNGWDSRDNRQLRLQEIPTGVGNRVRAEVLGLHEQICNTAEDLLKFFEMCFDKRSTASTMMNSSSSRSHALFTITVKRVIVSVGDGVDKNLRAIVRTEGIESKLHLVDLAGSERVKRSGAKGTTFREATNINSGLLALGNVICALAERNSHVPYRDSKLTRLVQADFEETNNTLKYANRACSILNQPLPNRFLMMEEDLLPVAPGAGADSKGIVSIEALLDHTLKQRELRERREREKKQKEEARREALSVKKEQLMKTKGYARILAQEYDRKLKEARNKGKRRFNVHETVDGQQIDTHASQSSLLTREISTPSLMCTSNSGFNFNEFVAHNATVNASESSGRLGGEATPETSDTASTQKPLTPALARALARKNQAKSQLAEPQEKGRSPPSAAAAPAPLLPAQPSPRTPENLPPSQPPAPTNRPGPVEQQEDIEEEPLAAEIEARVREEAERAALQQVAAEVGEPLNEVDEEGDSCASQEKSGDEPVDMDAGDSGVKVLARFKVNKLDCVSVFKASTREDFRDVVKLLPENTPLPASNKMTYLIARLELHPEQPIADRLASVNNNGVAMAEAVGPAVGCLMATFGTNMISSCIFDFDDPTELEDFAVEERIELWGLQIPHNSLRPVLKEIDAEEVAQGVQQEQEEQSQLLKRWQGAGVRMKEVHTRMKLIYPPHAHDFEYYKSSTVAFFLVDEVQVGLQKKLALLD